MPLSDVFRIGGLDAYCLARNHSGALVDDAASGQASDSALVRCAKRRRFRQRLPGRTARGRAAQDRLDASRGRWRSRPLAAAGPPGAQPLDRRCSARWGARPRDRDARRTGGRAGDRRDRLPEARPRLLRRGATGHRLGGQDHQLPDRGVCRLQRSAFNSTHEPTAPVSRSRIPTSRTTLYVSDKGHAFIDRQLYLPKAWTGDPARMTAAHVPAGITFATKPHLALGLVARAIAAGVPFAWVTADTVYGVGAIELALRRADKGYVLGVTGQHSFWSWGAAAEGSGTAEEIATALVEEDWIRLPAGAGTKGPRLYDWAYLELASLTADARDPTLDQSLWTRGLLVRRSLSDGSLAYFTTWCPAGTPIQELVAVEGRRWAIEDAFETAKTELGLAHNESRSWHGWHRHVSLVMLAFALLARVRQLANGPPPKTTLIAKLAGSLVDPGNQARSDPPGATAH